MKKIDNKRQALIWGIVMLAVLGATIGVFLDVAPETPRYSYWIAMADVCVMEILTGIYLIYTVFLSTNKATNELPVAMHIGMKTTVGIFFGATVVIDIIFLLVSNSSTLDRAFMWVVIGKWILLLSVLAFMQLAGREGEEEREILASSRAEGVGVGVLSTVEQALGELRRLPTSTEEGALQRQVLDELETLRNQVRSRVSARLGADGEGWHLDNLLDELGSSVASLSSAPESERRGLLLSVRETVKKMSREISQPPATKKV